MPRRSIQVEFEAGRTDALIVLGRTRSALRVISIDPPARELRELEGNLLVRWATPPGPLARIELEYWGVPLVVVETRTFALGPFDKLDRDELPRRSDPEQLRQWRRDAASQITEHRAARTFFNGLDEGTSAFDVQREDLKALLLALFNERRANDRDPTAACDPSDYMRDAIDKTAKQFTDMFDTTFANQRELEDAFDLFARGELSMLEVAHPGIQDRDAGQACQPDSILVYLFAEFAHLCVVLGVKTTGKFASPGVWKALLPTLIHAHRCFCKAYGQRGKFDSSSETTGIQRRRQGLRSVQAERDLALKEIQKDPLRAWADQAREDVVRPAP